MIARAAARLLPHSGAAGARPDLVLIANARASGLGGTNELLDAARTALEDAGAHLEVVRTSTAAELASLAGDRRRLVLLGGDGTVHALANEPALAGRELALLPAGRANNVARSLGVPTALAEAARLAVTGSARPLDVIEATTPGRRYLAVEGVSVGFHALARVRYGSENSADLRSGVAAALTTLGKFRPISIVLESNGMSERETLSQLFVANLPLFGFGFRVAPEADPRDGLLDVVALGPRSRLSILASLARVRRGTHVGRAGTRLWRTDAIRIDPGGESPVIADTVNLGTGPVELCVQRGALAVVAPPCGSGLA